MSVCDCGHDREAEPGTGSGSVSLAETLEGVLEELRRKPLAFVGDVQHDCIRTLDGIKPHRARAVAERVLDEVGERLLESPPVTMTSDSP